jgi:hypothetical protein
MHECEWCGESEPLDDGEHSEAVEQFKAGWFHPSCHESFENRHAMRRSR